MVYQEQNQAAEAVAPKQEQPSFENLPGLSAEERVTEILRDNLSVSPEEDHSEDKSPEGTDLFVINHQWDPDIHFPFSYRAVATTSEEKAQIATAIIGKLQEQLPDNIDGSTLQISRNQGNSNLSFTADTEAGPVHIRVRLGGSEHYQLEKERMDLARSLSTAGTERVAEVLAIGDLGEINGNSLSYSIQPRLEATPLTEVSDPQVRLEVLKDVAEVVAPLHQITDVEQVFSQHESLSRLHDTVTNATKPEYGTRLVEAGILTSSEWDTLRERFESFEWNHDLMPCAVHDDLNSNNILYNENTGAIYVIDWELPTTENSRYKDNAGFAVLGRFREMISFTPILANDAEQRVFVEGLGMEADAFIGSPLKQDLDTIQLAMVTSVAGYFIDAAQTGNSGAQKNLESIRDYLQDRLAA